MTEYDPADDGRKSYDLAITALREEHLSRVVVAIDPGLNGGVAILGGTGHLKAFDIPTMGEKTKRRLNGAMLARFVIETHVTCAVIEKASARPAQGVSSSFRFGMAFGQCLGILEALFIPMETVAPSRWKREMKLDSSKENSRLRAIEMYPKYEHFFTRKKDHNRAEAALLASWWMNRGERDG